MPSPICSAPDAPQPLWYVVTWNFYCIALSLGWTGGRPHNGESETVLMQKAARYTCFIRDNL